MVVFVSNGHKVDRGCDVSLHKSVRLNLATVLGDKISPYCSLDFTYIAFITAELAQAYLTIMKYAYFGILLAAGINHQNVVTSCKTDRLSGLLNNCKSLILNCSFYRIYLSDQNSHHVTSLKSRGFLVDIQEYLLV